jgi:hypothetical protein
MIFGIPFPFGSHSVESPATAVVRSTEYKWLLPKGESFHLQKVIVSDRIVAVQ